MNVVFPESTALKTPPIKGDPNTPTVLAYTVILVANLDIKIGEGGARGGPLVNTNKGELGSPVPPPFVSLALI